METPKIDNIENMEHYMLYGRGEIMQKLRQLSKKNSLITLHFNDQTMLSTVVDVLADKNLLVLDYGGDEKLNEKLLKHDRAVIKTDYDGITAQFSINGIRKARLQGKPSFACPLPESVLWVQRREFYRVRIPLSEVVTCELIHGDNNRTEYPVLDISTGGIALFDQNDELELEPGNVFHNCKLTLGEHDAAFINLEIRNHIPINAYEASEGTRCGCAFLNLSGDFEVSVQKFINIVDQQQKRTE
ncbi:MAG: flagellar brake protein [Gammaproteobacteria bacterium]|nr:flagellar brake protein [Gammaproteobacteria bacterium]MCW8986817.1 flagellar brake protein [Gammaproteobacteria bacterium]MCW9032547.1 flagellar brake protein [Gammaproteobacteria bacterium]